jgi:hypothetical protein
VAAGVLFVGALIVPGLTESGNDSASTAGGSPAALDEAADQSEPVDLAQYDVTRTGTEYQTARLDSQVTELVAARSGQSAEATLDGEDQASSPPTSPTAASSAPESTTADGFTDARTSLLLSADAARICLQNYLYAPDLEPLAIDIGVWKSQQAAIVVLPVVGDASQLEVWVIDPSCADNAKGDVTVWHYQKVDAS